MLADLLIVAGTILLNGILYAHLRTARAEIALAREAASDASLSAGKARGHIDALAHRVDELDVTVSDHVLSWHPTEPTAKRAPAKRAPVKKAATRTARQPGRSM